MREREGLVAGGLTALLVVAWLGFLVHRSPRFAGTALGGALGVSGAVLMLAPLAYVIVKRWRWLKRRLTKYVSMRTLLAWHIYAGIAGPILVLLHTGHKFESPLGVALTATTLIVVASGVIGRYLLARVRREGRETSALHADLQRAYAAEVTAASAAGGPALRPLLGARGRLAAALFHSDADDPLARGARVIQLAEAVADTEVAAKTHDAMVRVFGVWLRTHLVLTIVLYALLGAHVWAAIHFGLRWFGPGA